MTFLISQIIIYSNCFEQGKRDNSRPSYLAYHPLHLTNKNGKFHISETDIDIQIILGKENEIAKHPFTIVLLFPFPALCNHVFDV